MVLLDSSRNVLERYPFTPDTAVFATTNNGAEPDLMLVDLQVPYHRSTAQVDLVGPDGLLARVRAGMSVPQVTLRTPNGGEVLDMDPITITWAARDDDRDSLTFNVDYSPDNGRTWQLIASGVTDQSVEVPAASVPASDSGLMRVWASDGIHTASDTSDGRFTVPNRPPMVEISRPADGLTALAGQSVAFEALAYDVDLSSTADLALQWSSSLDGPLGQGGELTLASLSQGVVITPAACNSSVTSRLPLPPTAPITMGAGKCSAVSFGNLPAVAASSR